MFASSCPLCGLKQTFIQRGFHVRFVPEADIGESPTKTASWPTSLCSALFRRQQCQQGDTPDDGENRAIDEYSCMANVVPQ